MTRQAIVDATLPDGSRADVVIDGERVVEVGPGVGAAVEAQVDAAGGLLLPAYIDTHIHLDKVLIRDQLVEHDGTLRGAIEAIHAAKRAYTVDDVRRRAAEVIRCSVLTGTTRLRSHVDVDTVGGLVPIEGVLAAARDCAGIAEVRTIAFPQEGILRDPGTAELMVAAMEAGADVVGGMPHWEQGEDDQREHVRWCFELARRFDADVDMHVDETDDGSVRTLAMVVDETERTGWQGRVTVGHVCALSAADDDYAARVIAGCAGAGIVVVSNPVTNLVLQGRGDLLEVALVSAHAAQLTTGAELRQALAAVTTVPATAWRLGDNYGVSAGARADLQLYAAAGWPEVLRLQDPPRAVWFRGRTVARTTVQRELLG
ncbi:MAG: cytosine/creatinine deaminase [Actinomycetota bacterium]|nr:cytosine/creatinine deaminase [Actinomycetota bacterium]